MLKQELTLSVLESSYFSLVQMMQGDTGRVLEISIKDFEIPSGASAQLYIHRPNETFYTQSATISDQKITVEADQIITTAGYVQCNLEISKSGETIQSFPFTIQVTPTEAGSPQTEEKGTSVEELDERLTALEETALKNHSRLASAIYLASDAGVELDVVGASSISMTDRVQISGHEGVNLSPHDGQATVNNSKILTSGNVTEDPFLFPQWEQIADYTTTGSATTTVQTIPLNEMYSEDADAWRDFVILVTAPANSTWTSYPDIGVVRFNGTQAETISQFTLTTRTTALTEISSTMVQSLAWGNGRFTLNGFDFAKSSSYITLRVNPDSSTVPAKPWFSIWQSNWGNRIVYKNVPAGWSITVYGARHLSLNNYIEQ